MTSCIQKGHFRRVRVIVSFRSSQDRATVTKVSSHIILTAKREGKSETLEDPELHFSNWLTIQIVWVVGAALLVSGG